MIIDVGRKHFKVYSGIEAQLMFFCFCFCDCGRNSKVRTADARKITAGVKRRWFFNRCPTELYSTWAIDEQSAQSYEAYGLKT